MSSIEVMARAMWEKESLRAFGKPRNIAWGDVDKYTVAKWHGLATAALLALSQMEPTPGMVEAGTMEHFGTKRGDYHYEGGDARSVEAIFRAMLAAAVKEGNNDKSE